MPVSQEIIWAGAIGLGIYALWTFNQNASTLETLGFAGIGAYVVYLFLA